MIKLRNKIKNKLVSDLKPYEKNSKNHPEEQINLLIENIKQFGFTTPLLVDENNTIISGHGRYLAAKELELEEIPVILIDDLTESQKKTLRISDNRVGEFGEIDFDLIKEEREFIENEDSSLLDILGYEEDLFEVLEEPNIDKSEVEQDYEAYINAQIKKISFYLESNEYDFYISKLDKIKEKENLKDNSAVIKKLIDEK